MALFLVDPGLDLSFEIFVPPGIESSLRLQWERVRQDSMVRDSFRRRVEDSLASTIGQCLDCNIKEPTPAQLAFATVIAKKLGISLPAEALRYRGQMAEFLEKHAPEFKSGRKPVA